MGKVTVHLHCLLEKYQFNGSKSEEQNFDELKRLMKFFQIKLHVNYKDLVKKTTELPHYLNLVYNGDNKYRAMSNEDFDMFVAVLKMACSSFTKFIESAEKNIIRRPDDGVDTGLCRVADIELKIYNKWVSQPEKGLVR